jgi:hypothetical protein
MKIWVLVNLHDKTVGHGTTAGVAELGSKSAYGFDPLPAFKTREAAEAYIAGDAFMEIFLKPVELEVLS